MLIFGNYAIDQDANNYIVQQRAKHGAKSKTPGVEYWKDLASYPVRNLDLALQNVFHRKIADADKQEIAHCIKAINDAKKEILEAVKNV